MASWQNLTPFTATTAQKICLEPPKPPDLLFPNKLYYIKLAK